MSAMARTVETPITYTWKCSRCRKCNVISTLIRVKKEKRRKRIVSTNGPSVAPGIPEDLLGKRGHYAVYRTLGLNHACKWCGYKEVWAVPNLNWINNLIFSVFCIFLAVPAAVALIVGIVMLFNGDWGVFLYSGGVMLLLFLLASIVDKAEDHYSRKKDLLMSNLPITAFPTLVINGSPVANGMEFAEDYYSVDYPPGYVPPDTDEGTESSKTAQADDTHSFCSYCGAIITENGAKFCWKCGHSLQQH